MYSRRSLFSQARNNAFRNLKSIAECLADEIINASHDNQNSYAIKKKVRPLSSPS